MGRCYVRFAIENPSHFHIMTRPEFYSAGDEDFSRGYQEVFDTIRAAAAAALRATGGEGLDPQAFLIATWATVHGLATLWLDGTLEDRIGPVDIEVIATDAFDLAFAGSAGATLAKSAPSRDS